MPDRSPSDGHPPRPAAAGLSGAAARRGATSAEVGARGLVTRDRILAGALAEFADRGFHATTVEDIATALGTSRATVYQYFESREAIFEELASGLGTALLRLTGALGPVGPTAEGYRSIRDWVEGFRGIYEEQAAVFVQWPDVMPGSDRLRSLGSAFTARFAAVLRRRLGAVAEEVDLAVVLAMLAIVERASFLLATGRTGGDAQVLDMAATTIQVTLFPSTPLAVLAVRREQRVSGSAVSPAPRPATRRSSP